jgi:DNA-binding protein H-NS
MANATLLAMDVESLLRLREQVDAVLRDRRAELQQKLALLNGGQNGRLRGGSRGARGSSLKGRKIPPKYRSQSGETWTGRGIKPRWLVAALKRGKKLDSFLIR